VAPQGLLGGERAHEPGELAGAGDDDLLAGLAPHGHPPPAAVQTLTQTFIEHLRAAVPNPSSARRSRPRARSCQRRVVLSASSEQRAELRLGRAWLGSHAAPLTSGSVRFGRFGSCGTQRPARLLRESSAPRRQLGDVGATPSHVRRSERDEPVGRESFALATRRARPVQKARAFQARAVWSADNIRWPSTSAIALAVGGCGHCVSGVMRRSAQAASATTSPMLPEHRPAGALVSARCVPTAHTQRRDRRRRSGSCRSSATKAERIRSWLGEVVV
jgi:hypothetical protein